MSGCACRGAGAKQCRGISAAIDHSVAGGRVPRDEMAPRAALLAWALLLSAAALHCCAAGGSDPVEELSSPRGIAADRIHALDGLRYSAGDYEEEEAESSTADGASYVVKPFGAEEVDSACCLIQPRAWVFFLS